MRIAAIMTVHNRKEKTLNCLEGLFSNRTDAELVCYMTDDGCTDGTAQAVKQRFPQVRIVQGDGTLFWNRGMRKAWEVAVEDDYDLYFWLNDDTELMVDALERLLWASERTNHESIIVGSTCRSKEDKTLTYGGRGSDKKHKIIPPDEKSLKVCTTINGNIVLIPRKVVETIGLNDPYFRHSFGDIDYGLAATKAGLKNYIAPGFYGYCERNYPVPIFRRKGCGIVERYKLLYSPLGFNPLEDFHLNRKYTPLYKCVLWFLKLHVNVLFTE